MSDQEPDAGSDGTAGDLETIHRSMSTLGQRIDALVTSTTTYRAALTDRLAGIEDRLTVVASNDSATALRSHFDTLHAALEELGQRVAGGGDPTAVVERLARVEDELASSGKITTESFGEIAGVRAKIDAILGASANESGAVSTTLEQLKETLQDLASGEVVGALWDEVRQVRATVEAIVDRDVETTDPAAVEALRADVTDLTESVRQLLEQAEVVDEDERIEPAAPAPAAPAPAELSPEALADLRAVRSGVEDIIGRLDEGFDLETDVVPVETSPELTDQIATLSDQVRAELEQVRALVEDRGEAVDLTPLTARLDVLHDDLADQRALAEPPAEAAAPQVDLSEVLESLGDIQEGIAHLLDRPEPSEAPAPAGDSAAYATLDPDVVDVLREEIRTAGAAGDELVETLAGELKALRRRIRLRAEGEIFSDEQLDLIAEAVARRLAD